MGNLSGYSLNSLGLAGFEQIEPKPAWSQRLVKSMKLVDELPKDLESLKSLFAEELKEIIWLSQTDLSAAPFASAAYPEVPGVVFLTPAVFSYVPPNLILSAKNPYLAFENMIHECLHHRGEKLFRSSSILNPLMIADVKVNVSWRKTEWSFSHAIQAYYIYIWVARLRNWRKNDETESVSTREALASSLTEVNSIIEELEEQLSHIAGISCSDLRILVA